VPSDLSLQGTAQSAPELWLYAPLVQGADGALYGTTSFGGTSNQGVEFRLALDGTSTVMHSFSGPDGMFPQWGLVLARDGNFYGTAVSGGSGNGGTVFRLSPAGSFTTQYSFDPANSGVAPSALIQATNGKLYGTAAMGGASIGGTVFSVTTSGSVVVLHSFARGSSGGDYPTGLVQASDGTFYGTTANFGSNSLGTVFQLLASGTATVVHTFNPGSVQYPYDGAQPLAPPIQAQNGQLYGTTVGGGFYGASPGYGTVYQVAPIAQDK
jgi:uncharacterized repeat protein (TIGR03803 family)